MDLKTEFVAAFTKLAKIFPDVAPIQRMHKGQGSLRPGDIASFLVELDHLKIYDNLENFAVFSRYIADFGIKLFQSEFLFSTAYQFRLSESEQRACYDLFVQFAGMNNLLTDDYIATEVFPGWEDLLKDETLRLFRSGAQSMDTNFTDTASGERYLLDLVERVKSALGVRFALGLRDGTLTFLDAKERLEDEFDKNPMELDEELGQNMLGAMVENKQIREGIESITPMLGKIPGITGRQKKAVAKKLRSKSGEKMIKDAIAQRQGNSGREKEAVNIFITVVIDGLLPRFPAKTRVATRNAIRRRAVRFGRRLASEADALDGNYVKNVTDLSAVTARAAASFAESAPGCNFSSTRELSRRTMGAYLGAVGFPKKDIVVILNEGYGKPARRNRGSKRRRR